MTTKVLPANAMSQAAEFSRRSYHVVVDNDVTLDDIMKPAFWAHHIPKLEKHALIDVVRNDGSLDVQLRVIETGIGFASMRPLRVWEDGEVAADRAASEAAIGAHNSAETAIPPEFKITHNVKTGFTVTLAATGAVISKGHKLRGEAVASAKSYASKAGIAWPEPEEKAA